MNTEAILNYYEQEKQKKIEAGTWTALAEMQHNLAIASITNSIVSTQQEELVDFEDATTKYKDNPTLLW